MVYLSTEKNKFETAIPSVSNSSGLHLFNSNKFYFASHYSIFSSTNINKPVFTCDEIIKNFSYNQEKIAVLTERRVYLVRDSVFDSSFIFFSIKADKVKLVDNCLITVTKNIMCVWILPDEYKFVLFKRFNKMSKHTGRIISVEYVDEYVFTASTDNTVIYGSIWDNKSRVIWRNKYNIRFVRAVSVGFDGEPNMIVGSENGEILFINDEDKTSLKVEGRILFASNLQDRHFAVITRVEEGFFLYLLNYDKILLKKELEERPLEVNLCKSNSNVFLAVKFKKSIEIMFHNHEVLETVQTYCLLDKIQSFSDNLTKLVIKDVSDKLTIFDKRTKRHVHEINLEENVSSNELEMVMKTEKANNKHFTKISETALFVVSEKGFVMVYNINDYNCYRKYQIPIEVQVEKIDISEDSQFLILQSQNTVVIYNVKLNKECFTFNNPSEIIQLQFYKEHIYFIDLDYRLVKLNVFSDSGKTTTLIESPKPFTCFKIDAGKLFVGTANEVEIYTIYNEYIETILIDEEVLSFDVLKDILYINSKDSMSIYKNGNLVEKIKFRDQEIQEIKICQDGEIILRKDDQLVFYRKVYDKVTFYNNDINRISEYIEEKNYLKGLVTALQLKDIKLIQKVLIESDKETLKSVIKMIQINEVLELYESIKFLSITSKSTSPFNELNKKIILVLKYLYFYHKTDLPTNESKIFEKIVEENYKISKENYYLLKYLLE